MKHPWQVWLVYAVCVFGAAGAMAWLTRQAVEADQMRRAAEAGAELEQRVSLALWRMDTELAPIIAEEVIRPASAYRPVANVAAELPPYVLLQFEIEPNGRWISPQSPGAKSALPPPLRELSRAVTYQQLLPELPSTPLPTVVDIARNQVAANMAANAGPSVPQTAAQIEPLDNPYTYFEGNRVKAPAEPPRTAQSQAPQQAPDVSRQAQSVQLPPQIKKQADFQQRSKRYQSATQQSLLNLSQRGLPSSEQQELPTASSKGGISATKPGVEAAEQVGISRPVWAGERLLLARRVATNGTTVVQGSWLDWPRLKARLLGEASDLLPKADLVPVINGGNGDPGRMLAGLPVRLVVNESVATPGIGPTLRWALWMGWSAVLIVVLAAAALLHGVMTLSERRAAFVSSVTHELRTPLTTFRMYAEMLAKGMVPDAARRQEYFETLQKESERLTLLVENVLSYARLERGRKPLAQDRVTVVDILDRVRPRLEQRAAQAGMECVFDLPLPLGEGRGEGALKTSKTPSPCPLPRGDGFKQEITTDIAVVEQILFNLVDNAAKYARGATDRRIHVEANHEGAYVKLMVRDHGPGIGHEASARSQPFEKSAQESAESAPGVGLGLALCRRLARQLGGQLEVAKTTGGGATVALLLPS
jgi:signal transduction histidine kinase